MQRARPFGRDVEVARENDHVVARGLGDGEPRRTQQLRVGEALVCAVARAVQVRVVRGHEPDHVVEERRALGRHRVAVEHVPTPDEHPSTLPAVRVLLADPPAFTPWYDHELAAALARAGAEVELATSPFRFGEIPAPDGYRRSAHWYPLSSRLFKRSRARLPLKAVEHLAVMRSLSRARADV